MTLSAAPWFRSGVCLGLYPTRPFERRGAGQDRLHQGASPAQPLRDEEPETVAANPVAEAVHSWEPVSPQT